MQYILASQSPRRKELLARVVADFQTVPADIDETPYPSEQPIDYVQRMATQKAATILKTILKLWLLAAILQLSAKIKF